MLSENYKCIQGYECLAGCLSNYFNYYNIGINESDIFLCGEGYCIEYSGDIQYLQIGTKAYEANKKFIKKYDVPCKRGFFLQDIEALEMISNCIISEQPLIVRVNTSMLSYHSVYQNSQASPHWINVIGTWDNGYIISDCAIPSLKREKIVAQISSEELIEAWRKMHYEYIILLDEKLYGVDEEKIKRDSKERLCISFEKYIRPKKRLFSSTNYGVNAIYSLLDSISRSNWNNREELDYIIREINYQVKLNGVISHRYVIEIKLKELGCMEGDIKEFDEITDNWNNLFLKLLRAGMTGRINELKIIRDEAYAIKKREVNNISKILQNM